MLFTGTDYFLCPSEAVGDDLVTNWRVSRESVIIIPYGMNPKWLELVAKPKRGRVLFVGTADLRKGIHYLAMAADILRARGRDYEFRVAGDVTDKVKEQRLCQNLTFLGRIPRDQIHEEFSLAAIFVLPSLAEGSAEVTYEALASGVPLVVTASAGSVARDGIEGKIVPERDAGALADALEELLENHVLRTQMALAARERAKEFTWDRYGERLVDALKNLKA